MKHVLKLLAIVTLVAASAHAQGKPNIVII